MFSSHHHHIHEWTNPGFPTSAQLPRPSLPPLHKAPSSPFLSQTLPGASKLLFLLWVLHLLVSPLICLEPLLYNVNVQGSPRLTTAYPSKHGSPTSTPDQCLKDSDSCHTWVPSYMLVPWPGRSTFYINQNCLHAPRLSLHLPFSKIFPMRIDFSTHP